MSHPTFPISHLLFLFLRTAPLTRASARVAAVAAADAAMPRRRALLAEMRAARAARGGGSARGGVCESTDQPDEDLKSQHGLRGSNHRLSTQKRVRGMVADGEGGEVCLLSLTHTHSSQHVTTHSSLYITGIFFLGAIKAVQAHQSEGGGDGGYGGESVCSILMPYLEPSDWCSLARVCSEWRLCLAEGSLWVEAYRSRWKELPPMEGGERIHLHRPMRGRSC